MLSEKKMVKLKNILRMGRPFFIANLKLDLKIIIISRKDRNKKMGTKGLN